MSKVTEVTLPAYRKSANNEIFVKIRTLEEYIWIECAEKEHNQLSYRYEKTVTPRGIPQIFFDTYIESNEKEFLGAVDKYIQYSDKLKSHLNGKK